MAHDSTLSRIGVESGPKSGPRIACRTACLPVDTNAELDALDAVWLA